MKRKYEVNFTNLFCVKCYSVVEITVSPKKLPTNLLVNATKIWNHI